MSVHLLKSEVRRVFYIITSFISYSYSYSYAYDLNQAFFNRKYLENIFTFYARFTPRIVDHTLYRIVSAYMVSQMNQIHILTDSHNGFTVQRKRWLQNRAKKSARREGSLL